MVNSQTTEKRRIKFWTTVVAVTRAYRVTHSLASQTLFNFPVLVGVAGSAAGKKGLVSLGRIPWHLQECRQIQ